ncbi:hypothetical protein OOZ63_20955 [Paucibacter sp. PLA-PC-4]|uniref:hypothetical protein n=1 Tax=Paucibacter sp. PLA-PC-4 TaxID=2993655 RepID=UPI00224B98D9|nr:hypothetical protein [Paucibacter sp. PLA-PC-4]MCX2864301.1 hypothetical protein [Paucibacter sp. PLA-PC-4]
MGVLKESLEESLSGFFAPVTAAIAAVKHSFMSDHGRTGTNQVPNMVRPMPAAKAQISTETKGKPKR